MKNNVLKLLRCKMSHLFLGMVFSTGVACATETITDDEPDEKSAASVTAYFAAHKEDIPVVPISKSSNVQDTIVSIPRISTTVFNLCDIDKGQGPKTTIWAVKMVVPDDMEKKALYIGFQGAPNSRNIGVVSSDRYYWNKDSALPNRPRFYCINSGYHNILVSDIGNYRSREIYLYGWITPSYAQSSTPDRDLKVRCIVADFPPIFSEQAQHQNDDKMYLDCAKIMAEKLNLTFDAKPPQFDF